MKILLFLAIVLPQLCSAQKLVVGGTDTTTGRQVKETEWIKMRCKDRSVLLIKARRVNDDIRIYHRSRLKGKSLDATCNFVDIALFFEKDNALQLPSEQMRFIMDERSSGWKFNTGEQERTKWEEPHAIPSTKLSQGQIDTIENNKLTAFQMCFFGKPIRTELKEKDQEHLSKCIKAVM